MPDDERVPRRSPPTPRSARLGREFRSLRERKGWTMEQAAAALGRSQSWLSRVESGLIKLRPGDAALLLMTYGVALEADPAKAMIATARTVGEAGWWQGFDTLSLPYMTYIGFEREATEIRNYEPTLIPGLLQTRDYAEAIARIGLETDPEHVQQRVDAKMKRQQEVFAREHPPWVHAVVSEAALLCEVGGRAVLAEQLRHVVELAQLPYINVQVLRFAAGAHLAERGGFAILCFGGGDPDLGHIETTTGSLFLEATKDVNRLTAVFDDVVMRSMSPAESVQFIEQKARDAD